MSFTSSLFFSIQNVGFSFLLHFKCYLFLFTGSLCIKIYIQKGTPLNERKLYYVLNEAERIRTLLLLHVLHSCKSEQRNQTKCFTIRTISHGLNTHIPVVQCVLRVCVSFLYIQLMRSWLDTVQ